MPDWDTRHRDVKNEERHPNGSVVYTAADQRFPNLHQWVVEPATNGGAVMRYGIRNPSGQWQHFPAAIYDNEEEAHLGASRHQHLTEFGHFPEEGCCEG